MPLISPASTFLIASAPSFAAFRVSMSSSGTLLIHSNLSLQYANLSFDQPLAPFQLVWLNGASLPTSPPFCSYKPLQLIVNHTAAAGTVLFSVWMVRSSSWWARRGGYSSILSGSSSSSQGVLSRAVFIAKADQWRMSTRRRPRVESLAAKAFKLVQPWRLAARSGSVDGGSTTMSF